MDEAPLLALFTRLREAGLPLGVKDYAAVVQALQGGYGLPDRPALARLCRLLWVRSADEQAVFDYYFEQFIGLEEIPDSAPPEQSRSEIRPRTSSAGLALYGCLGLLGLVIGAVVVIWWNLNSILNPPVDHLGNQTAPAPTSAIGRRLYVSTQKNPASPETAPIVAPAVQPIKTTEPLDWMLRWGWPFVLLAGGGGLWLIRSRIFQSRQPKSSPVPSTTAEARAKLTSELFQETGDAVLVAQAVGQGAKGADSRSSFLLTNDYLPVTQRQMRQSWRHLRRMVREGVATELDIEGTVTQIARHGLLLDPVLVPPRVNRMELLLLLDQDGSMVAFHSLAARLGETALRGGRLGRTRVYYFHNCPMGYLYQDPMHLEAETVEQVLGRVRPDRTVVLIFSDAGAARGLFSLERLEVTTAFLQQLRPQVRSVVWLNPMPRSRWRGTTAAEIGRVVPMVEGTRLGLERAIEVLRGK